MTSVDDSDDAMEIDSDPRSPSPPTVPSTSDALLFSGQPSRPTLSASKRKDTLNTTRSGPSFYIDIPAPPRSKSFASSTSIEPVIAPAPVPSPNTRPTWEVEIPRHTLWPYARRSILAFENDAITDFKPTQS